MIVREVQKLLPNYIGSSGLKGKCLISETDNAGFVSYLVSIEHNMTIMPIAGFHHIFYCLQGSANFSINGTDLSYIVNKDTVAAFDCTTQISVVLQGDGLPLTLFVTYAKATPSNESVQPTIVRLSEVLEDERNVDWGRGYSRRFLSKKHGFGISLHNTICHPNNTSKLKYPNNIEGCYYIRGPVRYIWDDGKKSFCMDHSHKEGVVYILDQHDEHSLVTMNKECETICVFYPALVGNENHNFKANSSSSF